MTLPSISETVTIAANGARLRNRGGSLITSEAIQQVPAYECTLSGSAAIPQTLINGEYTRVIFANEDDPFDIGDPASGQITLPVLGRWAIRGVFHGTGGSELLSHQIATIYVDGIEFYRGSQVGCTTDILRNLSASAAVTDRFTAGQIIELRAFQTNTGSALRTLLASASDPAIFSLSATYLGA